MGGRVGGNQVGPALLPLPPYPELACLLGLIS